MDVKETFLRSYGNEMINQIFPPISQEMQFCFISCTLLIKKPMVVSRNRGAVYKKALQYWKKSLKTLC